MKNGSRVAGGLGADRAEVGEAGGRAGAGRGGALQRPIGAVDPPPGAAADRAAAEPDGGVARDLGGDPVEGGLVGEGDEVAAVLLGEVRGLAPGHGRGDEEVAAVAALDGGRGETRSGVRQRGRTGAGRGCRGGFRRGAAGWDPGRGRGREKGWFPGTGRSRRGGTVRGGGAVGEFAGLALGLQLAELFLLLLLFLVGLFLFGGVGLFPLDGLGHAVDGAEQDDDDDDVAEEVPTSGRWRPRWSWE